MHTNM